MADADRVIDPDVAGLYCWPPSGDIGIFYDDLGQTVPPPGMVQLGTVTSGLPTIASEGNRFVVSIDRAEVQNESGDGVPKRAYAI